VWNESAQSLSESDELLEELLLLLLLLEEELELSESLSDELEEELLEEELLEEVLLSLSDESEPIAAARAFAAACCCIINFGAFLRCKRRPSVSAPRPMEVKKLMAKRVLRGLSLGNMPLKMSCMYWSWNRSFNRMSPSCSDSS